MKKLIVGLCATLVLASCGNDAEKKANERLTTAVQPLSKEITTKPNCR